MYITIIYCLYTFQKRLTGSMIRPRYCFQSYQNNPSSLFNWFFLFRSCCLISSNLLITASACPSHSSITSLFISSFSRVCFSVSSLFLISPITLLVALILLLMSSSVLFVLFLLVEITYFILVSFSYAQLMSFMICCFCFYCLSKRAFFDWMLS